MAADSVTDDPLDEGLGLSDVLPGDPTARPGTQLLLGPVLRYADAGCATVWLETSASAQVSVLGRTTPTFEVQGHHYGYVMLDRLAPGTDTPYQV
ncbi:MAG: hypothetical protein M3P93_11785, partial [Actinomycetota bacterium]|nr:hypothetical protein [Actinomycetota bacterium]